MNKLLLTLLIVIFAQGCKTKISLPKEMPNDVNIFIENEDPNSRANIDTEKITFYTGSGWHNRTKTEHRTNREDVEKLYQVFIENKFDQIEPESAEGNKLNEIKEIRVLTNKQIVAVYPSSLTYSEQNKQRIMNINKAILDFVEVQKGKRNLKNNLGGK